MAWILVAGEDVVLYVNALSMLRRAGHEVVATSEGTTVLQMLSEVAHPMIVLLEERIGQMDVLEFLAAAAPDDILHWRHAYILLRDDPDELPAEVERYRAELTIPLVSKPGDSSDTDGWADLLDTISLIANQFGHQRQ